MKFSPPSERTQLVLASPLLLLILPFAIPGVAVLAVAVTYCDWNNSRLARRGWHNWLAWRPVEIDRPFGERRKYAWLETVERKRFGSSWGYRAEGSAE